MRHVLAAVAVLAASCTYGPQPDRRTDYVVLFAPGSTALDHPQADLVAAAGRAAAALPGATVTVAGYGDPVRAPQSNQIDSRIRAQLVADALVADGVPRSTVRLAFRRAIGGDPGVESGRVEIRIDP